MKYTFLVAFFLTLISLFGFSTTANASDSIRRQRVAASPQWNGESFQNPERVPAVKMGASLKSFWDYFFNKPEGPIPVTALPMEPFDISQWDGQQAFKFAWLGHAIFLLRIGDKFVLTDPMFSQRAGPFGWLSPLRYSKKH